jgi:diguanylate cyclase
METSSSISGRRTGVRDSAAPGALSTRERRMRQRRQMLDLIGVSYLIDAMVLLIYAFAGTIPLSVVPTYAACGLIIVTGSIAASEAGFNDRFKDHYLVVPTAIVNLTMMIAFSYWVPQVAFAFLCALFIVFSFSSLRATLRQNAVSWTVMTVALAGLFLLSDRPVEMPHGSALERLATLLTLVLSIGRCMFIGMFSSSMRESLYKRGVELKEAYRRIEELAELDELTGAYNRRCIVRMLDDEIDRARRSGKQLSLALIDLDWFKRINDSYGHPIGDEVLRTFAISIFANIRSFDRFGRYGGEEFLLILPDTPRDAAAGLLDRLREIVAELDWSAFSPGMKVTLSAGVTAMSAAEHAETALARADGALYAAKEAGRNRIATA